MLEELFWLLNHKVICNLLLQLIILPWKWQWRTLVVNFLKVSVGFFQFIFGFLIQLQNRCNHDNWLRVVLRHVVSADKVLVTTRWIFLQPHEIGLTGQTWFLEISSWVAMIIIPVWDSGIFLEANDASETAWNLIFSMGIDWMWMEVSLWRLASWRIRFPWNESFDGCLVDIAL